MLLTYIDLCVKFTSATASESPELGIVELCLNLVSFVRPVEDLSILLHIILTGRILVVCLVALIDNIAFSCLCARCFSIHHSLIILTTFQSNMMKVLSLVLFHLHGYNIFNTKKFENYL